MLGHHQNVFAADRILYSEWKPLGSVTKLNDYVHPVVWPSPCPACVFVLARPRECGEEQEGVEDERR